MIVVNWGIKETLNRVRSAHLAEIVEVVLAVDPAIRWSLVEAICLVDDVTDVASLAVIQHSLEQLSDSSHIFVQHATKLSAWKKG